MVICQEKMLLGKEEHQLSFYIQLGWDVELVGDVFSVLFTLSDAFGQEIFDLSVHRSEVILCPCGDRVIELFRQSERNLFLSVIAHINTSFPNSRRVEHRGYRRGLPRGSRPLRLFFHHRGQLFYFHLGAREPFPPFRLRRRRSFFSHR